MTTTLTSEEFAGYEFNCHYEDASTGFRHVCEVVKDGEQVLSTFVGWGNRTWESYPYKTVFEEAKRLLQDKLDGVKKPEIDTAFLNRLASDEYINDFGEDEHGDFYILVDSWKQVEEGSVWNKLVELAKKNLLSPSINATMLVLDGNFLFTDEYGICLRCGKIYSHYYGELQIVDYEYICYNCINEDEDIIKDKIREAKRDFSKALPVTIPEEVIEKLGYKAINNGESFSLSEHYWGETRGGYSYASLNKLQLLCKNFGGFAKIESVQQFDSPFLIYVPKHVVDRANEYHAH